MAKKLKVRVKYTPPGRELKLETPLKIKSDQWKRDLHQDLTGGLDEPKKSVKRLLQEYKVKAAGDAARKGKK